MLSMFDNVIVAKGGLFRAGHHRRTWHWARFPQNFSNSQKGGNIRAKTTWFSGKQWRKYSGRSLNPPPPPPPPNETRPIRLCWALVLLATVVITDPRDAWNCLKQVSMSMTTCDFWQRRIKAGEQQACAPLNFIDFVFVSCFVWECFKIRLRLHGISSKTLQALKPCKRSLDSGRNVVRASRTYNFAAPLPIWKSWIRPCVTLGYSISVI